MKRSILSLMYLIQGMHQAGIDLSDKLTSIGLRADTIDPSSVIDANLEKEILQKICEDLTPENGLKIGQHYTLAGYGPLLMLLVASPNIEVALNKAIEYCCLTHLTGQLHTVKQKNKVAVVYKPENLDTQFGCFLAQCEIAGTFKFIQELYQLIDLALPDVDVELPFKRPNTLSEIARYQKFYGLDVVFETSNAYFWFDEQVLKAKIPSFDEVTFNIYEEKCINESERLATQENIPSVVQSVKDYLALQNIVMPSMVETAKVLNIPERTLRHQLQQHDTSYKQIREEIMKGKALKMMEYKNYSIEMISELLGYSEPAAFNHAFKKWFGQSPRQYIK